MIGPSGPIIEAGGGCGGDRGNVEYYTPTHGTLLAPSGGSSGDVVMKELTLTRGEKYTIRIGRGGNAANYAAPCSTAYGGAGYHSGNPSQNHYFSDPAVSVWANCRVLNMYMGCGNPGATYAHGGASAVRDSFGVVYNHDLAANVGSLREWAGIGRQLGAVGLSLNGVTYGSGGNTPDFPGGVQSSPSQPGRDGAVLIVSTW